MVPTHSARSIVLGTLTAMTIGFSMSAIAQPGPGPGGGFGGMMGPGMMDRQNFGRMCSPRMAGFGEWRTDRIERELKMNDAQRAKLEDLRLASRKAVDAMRSACPSDVPSTLTARAEAMEKRMEAMLQGVRAVRPALEAFYDSLSEDQKSTLNKGSGRQRFWRWRDRW